jgi:hypothetical protein
MNSKVDKIRIRVFRVWFITLAIVIVAFAEKVSGIRHVSPPFSSTFQSFQMMVGLIVPQIGVMSAFYFNLDGQKNKIESLSSNQIEVITLMSLFYHLIFIISVIFGIVFYSFDSQADGNALERNTAAVVAIMGLFSLFLAPIAFLFAAPKTEVARGPAEKEV